MFKGKISRKNTFHELQEIHDTTLEYTFIPDSLGNKWTIRDCNYRILKQEKKKM